MRENGNHPKLVVKKLGGHKGLKAVRALFRQWRAEPEGSAHRELLARRKVMCLSCRGFFGSDEIMGHRMQCGDVGVAECKICGERVLRCAMHKHLMKCARER